MSAPNPTASARFAISRNAVHGTGLPSPSAPAPIGSDMPSLIRLSVVILSPFSTRRGRRGRTLDGIRVRRASGRCQAALSPGVVAGTPRSSATSARGGLRERRNPPGLTEQPQRDPEVEQVPEDAVDESPLI